MHSKLILIAHLSLCSYFGLTQIKFERMSAPFPARLYDRENREDVRNVKNILSEKSEAIKRESNNTLAIAFINPSSIDFIETKQNAELKIKSKSADSIETTGVVIAIANSVKEPEQNSIDYFNYLVLLKIEDRTIEKQIDNKTRFPITTRIAIDEEITVVDWLRIKFFDSIVCKYKILNR